VDWKHLINWRHIHIGLRTAKACRVLPHRSPLDELVQISKAAFKIKFEFTADFETCKGMA
jgi:hypothetical protein